MKGLLAILCLTLTVVASADDIWGPWAVEGDACKSSNVQFLANGDSVAILFNGFGVQMPAGAAGDGLLVRKACRFQVEFTPPKGEYLVGFEQTFSGGIIKSRKSGAKMKMNYRVGPRTGAPHEMDWERGITILPNSPDSLFEQTYREEFFVQEQCRKKNIYHLNLVFTGHRADQSEYLIGGLDSVDARLVQKVKLVPRWQKCR